MNVMIVMILIVMRSWPKIRQQENHLGLAHKSILSSDSIQPRNIVSFQIMLTKWLNAFLGGKLYRSLPPAVKHRKLFQQLLFSPSTYIKSNNRKNNRQTTTTNLGEIDIHICSWETSVILTFPGDEDARRIRDDCLTFLFCRCDRIPFQK